MRRTWRIGVALGVVLLVGLLVATSTLASALPATTVPLTDSPLAANPNLAPNPSFEAGTTLPTGWREDWFIYRNQTWEQGIAHSGQRSVSVSGPNCTPAGVRYYVRWLTVDPISVQGSTRYVLSAWTFTNEARGSIHIVVDQYDADGYSVGPYTAFNWPLTSSWARSSSRVILEPSARSVRLGLGYVAAADCSDLGTVYFDDVEFTLDDATTVGTVDLQGRTDDSGALVQLFGYSTMYSDTTDAAGSFGIQAPPGSVYLLMATMPGYLYAQRGSVVVSSGMTTTIPSVRLLGGDATGDNTIDIYDLTLLGASFGTSGGTADINGDGAVNIFDLAMVGANFGRSAPLPWP